MTSASAAAAAHDFYAFVSDVILAVGELYSTVSEEYQDFFDKATRDRDFYYTIVLKGRLTTQQALRYIQDNFESYLPDLA